MNEKKEINQNEEELDINVVKKYMEFNLYLMQFFRENFKGPFSFENRNRGQAYLLSVLKKHNYISQKELVELLDIKPQSASEIIKKLEKKEYIVRTKSIEDKRVMMIELTTKGKTEANAVGKFKPEMLECLSKEEKKQFNDILDKLLVDMQAKVKKPLKENMHRGPISWYDF